MTKYRNSTIFEAIQWTGDNEKEVSEFCSSHILGVDVPMDSDCTIFVEFNNEVGIERIRLYDWIVRYECRDDGFNYFIKDPQTFAETYECVEE